MLTCVTITGADDQIEPASLRALSEEFPFVEWAFLFSAQRTGTPRYPTATWIAMARHELAGLPLAAHVCGMAPNATAMQWVELAMRFDRIQINGWLPETGPTPWGLIEAFPGKRWVFQVRDEQWLEAAARVCTRESMEVLFDASAGRGIAPSRWPRAPLGVRMGYAGGITPDNVEEVLSAIAEERMTPPSVAPFWIDMESGVRTADRFDLGRVRRVLERARPFVGSPVLRWSP